MQADHGFGSVVEFYGQDADGDGVVVMAPVIVATVTLMMMARSIIVNIMNAAGLVFSGTAALFIAASSA